MRGWIYVMSNPAMPGMVKVGFSGQDPLKRAKELDGTGTPLSFVVEYDVLVLHAHALEQRIHKRLSRVRQRDSREWFGCSVAAAIAAVRAEAGSKLMTETRHRGSLAPSVARTMLASWDAALFKRWNAARAALFKS